MRRFAYHCCSASRSLLHTNKNARIISVAVVYVSILQARQPGLRLTEQTHMLHQHAFSKSTIPTDSKGKLQTLTLTNRVHFYSGCGLRIHEGALLPPQIYRRYTLAPRKLTHEGPLWFAFPVSLELQFWFGFLMNIS